MDDDFVKKSDSLIYAICTHYCFPFSSFSRFGVNFFPPRFCEVMLSMKTLIFRFPRPFFFFFFFVPTEEGQVANVSPSPSLQGMCDGVPDDPH
jgi:hypothetical protein